jgi:valyl-tRNA synthetase
MAEYVPVEIEAKWQKSWEESGSFEPDFETEKSRYYMLTILIHPGICTLVTGMPWLLLTPMPDF